MPLLLTRTEPQEEPCPTWARKRWPRSHERVKHLRHVLRRMMLLAVVTTGSAARRARRAWAGEVGELAGCAREPAGAAVPQRRGACGRRQAAIRDAPRDLQRLRAAGYFRRGRESSGGDGGWRRRPGCCGGGCRGDAMCRRVLQSRQTTQPRPQCRLLFPAPQAMRTALDCWGAVQEVAQHRAMHACVLHWGRVDACAAVPAIESSVPANR